MSMKPKICDKHVRRILVLGASGVPVADIAEKYGIAKSTVYGYLSGFARKGARYRRSPQKPEGRKVHVYGRSKRLTWQQVESIKDGLAKKLGNKELAQAFGCRPKTIERIAQGHAWAHVGGPGWRKKGLWLGK